MEGIARVRFEDAVVVMPFDRQSERERAFESAEFYARHYGEIWLELGGCRMEVRRAHGRPVLPCARCGRAARSVVFVRDAESFCPRCAREATTIAPRVSEESESRWPAAGFLEASPTAVAGPA